MNGFPEKLWSRLFAIEAIVWAAGSLLGPLIGGYFVNHSGWRGAFWFFGLQAVVLLVLSLALPLDAPQEGARAQWPVVPLAFLSAATLIIAHAGMAAGPATATVECLAGVVLLYVAARFDARSPDRLLPLKLLEYRILSGAGLLMVLALSMSTTGFWLYGPLASQNFYSAPIRDCRLHTCRRGLAWSLATMVVLELIVYRHIINSYRGSRNLRWSFLLCGCSSRRNDERNSRLRAINKGSLRICWPAIAHRLVLFASSLLSDRWRRHHNRRFNELATPWGTAAAGICSECIRNLTRELALLPPRRQDSGYSLALSRYYA